MILLLMIDAVPLTEEYFGSGTGPIFLNRLSCAGSETDILECNSNPITSSCTHLKDALVRCTGKNSNAVIISTFLNPLIYNYRH